MQADWCGWRLIRSVALILLAAAMTVPMSTPLRAQDTKEADALNAQVFQLYRAGKYAEAIPLAQRALAIDEKALGPDHPDVGRDLNNLARLYDSQGRYGDAEPLYKRALAIAEKAFGPDHPDVGTALNNLAELYDSQGRYGEAEPLYKRALAIREKALGPDHPDVGSARSTTWPCCTEPRAATARPSRSYKRALAIDEKALGPDHPDVGNAPQQPGRAVPRTRAATARPSRSTNARWRFTKRRSAPTTPASATYLNNLAALYRDQGRYGEAEPLYKRALAIDEKALGPDHPDVGRVLNNLAELYRDPGPLRRGRAALQARAGDRRKGARPRPSRRRHPTSTTWPSCIEPRAATATPSRSRSARWRSTKRPSAPTTPTSAETSTT